MKNIPITFYTPFIEDEKTRRVLLSEFAANGAENIVLSSEYIDAIKLDPGKAKLFQQEMLDAGLKFVDGHAPFSPAVDMNSSDNVELRILNHTLHLHIAALMGVKTITIHTGNDTNTPGVPVAQQLDNISFILDKLLPEAEKLDVAIAIENIWAPVNTPENLWIVKNRFPTPYLGFCCDVGHANIMSKQHGPDKEISCARNYWRDSNAGEPAWDDDILEKMLPEIINCHLHDNLGGTDQHILPGAGSIDWQKTVDLLKKAPRLQVIQSEVIQVRSSLSVKELVEKFKELFG
ncbi:MAG: sugar phosphate isomerase/epimerase [Lentisphaeria bacterium]|nr:sugar phosphate isomerase/epimerase [Lentisphaeria bacterium]